MATSPGRVVILVGLRLLDVPAYRIRNWEFAKRYWNVSGLGWPIVEGHYNDEGPFSLARASNRAAAAAGDWEIALYVGADFFLHHPQQAVKAVNLARRTGMLTFAHDTLIQLAEDETEQLVAGGALVARGERHPNTFSGVLAVPRALWDQVGGFDERFVGWGWDDIAFWSACWSLAGGFHRVPGLMYHLWHPRSRAENEDSPEHAVNMELGRRYLDVRGNREATLAILAERDEQP